MKNGRKKNIFDELGERLKTFGLIIKDAIFIQVSSPTIQEKNNNFFPSFKKTGENCFFPVKKRERKLWLISFEQKTMRVISFKKFSKQNKGFLIQKNDIYYWLKTPSLINILLTLEKPLLTAYIKYKI